MPRTPHKLIAIEAEYGIPLSEIIENARDAKVGQLELAQELGITSNYLAYYCDNNNIQRLGRRSRFKPSDEHRVKMAAAARAATERMYTLGGVTKSTGEWASELNLPKSTFRYRAKHWPEENVLSGESPHNLGEGHGGRRV